MKVLVFPVQLASFLKVSVWEFVLMVHILTIQTKDASSVVKNVKNAQIQQTFVHPVSHHTTC